MHWGQGGGLAAFLEFYLPQALSCVDLKLDQFALVPSSKQWTFAKSTIQNIAQKDPTCNVHGSQEKVVDISLKVFIMFCTINSESTSTQHLCLTFSSVAVKKAQGSAIYGEGAQKLPPDFFSTVTVLWCWGHHKRIPQTGGLQDTFTF